MTDIDTKALALRVADWLDCLSAGTTEICDLAPAEARTISRVLREAAEGTRYFLSTDNDSHWHLVPVARISEWEEWSAIPEDDERAWDAPEFATPLGGAPCLVTFAAPHLNGRPLPPPPSEAATLSQETHHEDK